MSKCYHTGLPSSMCGHCNGTNPLEREPFTGRQVEDETPRIFKGRDKTEWRGRGQSINGEVDLSLMRANAKPLRTAWARDNVMQDVLRLIANAGDIKPASQQDLDSITRPRVETTPDTRNIDGQVVVGAKHRASTPKRYFTEGSQVMRRARAQGVAGRVLASVKRKIGA